MTEYEVTCVGVCSGGGRVQGKFRRDGNQIVMVEFGPLVELNIGGRYIFEDDGKHIRIRAVEVMHSLIADIESIRK